MTEIRIRCPRCDWEPDSGALWQWSSCGCTWDTFTTRGQCPDCSTRYKETACLKLRGGCGEMSRHSDWYEYIEELPKSTFSLFNFFKREAVLPVTEADKDWTEQSMLQLIQMFGPEYFKDLNTVIPDKKYFDYKFTGDNSDAFYIMERLVDIMHINPLDIGLGFYYSGSAERFVTTPQEKLKGGRQSSAGQYFDHGLGPKEIWINESQIQDTISLIATLAHELSHYKLLGEYRIEENDEHLTDLTAIAFGFGVFIGNSYFKFTKWQDRQRSGWEMTKKGYLPEQVTAYAMAWLAHYRNEDIGWKTYLNKTMKKYFDQSYKYIAQNKDKVRWE